jgi:hypothetical protein
MQLSRTLGSNRNALVLCGLIIIPEPIRLCRLRYGHTAALTRRPLQQPDATTLSPPDILVYFMSTPSNSSLRRLVERDKCSSPLPSLLNAPTVGDTSSEAQPDESQPDEPVAIHADLPDDDNYYVGLDFKRVPYLERRQARRSKKLDLPPRLGRMAPQAQEELLALPDLPQATAATGGLLRG